MPDESVDARSLSAAGDGKISRCPVCSGSVEAASQTRPFCSARCRLVDLGKWLREDYRISRAAQERDLEEGV